MAIELSPEQRRRRSSLSSRIVFVSSLLLLFLAIASFIGLRFYQKKKAEELEGLKRMLETSDIQEMKNLEKEILKTKEKIESFSVLVENYQKISPVFEFLKETNHKQAYLTNINFYLEKEKKLEVSGKTKDFKTLSEQVFLYRADSRTTKAELTKADIDPETGLIVYTVTLYLNWENLQ